MGDIGSAQEHPFSTVSFSELEASLIVGILSTGYILSNKLTQLSAWWTGLWGAFAPESEQNWGCGGGGVSSQEAAPFPLTAG